MLERRLPFLFLAAAAAACPISLGDRRGDQASDDDAIDDDDSAQANDDDAIDDDDSAGILCSDRSGSLIDFVIHGEVITTYIRDDYAGSAFIAQAAGLIGQPPTGALFRWMQGYSDCDTDWSFSINPLADGSSMQFEDPSLSEPSCDLTLSSIEADVPGFMSNYVSFCPSDVEVLSVLDLPIP